MFLLYLTSLVVFLWSYCRPRPLLSSCCVFLVVWATVSLNCDILWTLWLPHLSLTSALLSNSWGRGRREGLRCFFFVCVCLRRSKSKNIPTWRQIETLRSPFILSGAAEDHRTARLWGGGVSEEGPDPQWPPPRPAALPRRRCLGESPPPPISTPLWVFLQCQQSFVFVLLDN